MTKIGAFLLITVATIFSAGAGAWEGHYMLTHAALRDWRALSPQAQVMPESLERFVEAEKISLIPILRDYERWAQTNIIKYPPLPAALVFDGKASGSALLKKFLMSLRINPELSYPNFVLYPEGVPHRIINPPTPAEAKQDPWPSLLALRAKSPVAEKIPQGMQVSPLEILSSAAEEPDHGLDFGIWQDNESPFSKLSGMGTQPFGNPVLSYSSQAPFHMGFFFESPILYTAAGWLSRCYPEYRISLFLTLSRHAFATGHTYWGYRFLGWALHYIQDLTQPYHATLAPGVSWPKLIGLNILEIIGIKTPAQNLRQLLTNRHLALENYQFESTRILGVNPALAQALADIQEDKKYPHWDLNYARHVIAKQSHGQAQLVDALLLKAMPTLYVADPSYLFSGTDDSINLREISFNNNKAEANKLEGEFLSLMKAFGAHTRNVAKALLPQS